MQWFTLFCTDLLGTGRLEGSGELVEQQPQRALARSQLQQTAFTFVSLQLGGGGNGCRIIWTEKHDIINWIRAVLKEKRGHSHLINIAFVLALG